MNSFSVRTLIVTASDDDITPNTYERVSSINNRYINVVQIDDADHFFRDLYFDDGNIYISLQSKSSKGFAIDIYKAKFDLKKLDFELFFKSNEYWDEYNVFSGGRIENYKDNKIICIDLSLKVTKLTIWPFAEVILPFVCPMV